MKTKTITARMDEQVIFQIEYLKDQLGASSTTRVLTEAVHLLYSSVKDKKVQKSPFELLEELNLIGCCEGEKNLSRDYKKELNQTFAKKHFAKRPKKKS